MSLNGQAIDQPFGYAPMKRASQSGAQRASSNEPYAKSGSQRGSSPKGSRASSPHAKANDSPYAKKASIAAGVNNSAGARSGSGYVADSERPQTSAKINFNLNATIAPESQAQVQAQAQATIAPQAYAVRTSEALRDNGEPIARRTTSPGPVSATGLAIDPNAMSVRSIKSSGTQGQNAADDVDAIVGGLKIMVNNASIKLGENGSVILKSDIPNTSVTGNPMSQIAQRMS